MHHFTEKMHLFGAHCRGVKWQWGCRRRQFLAIWVPTSSDTSEKASIASNIIWRCAATPCRPVIDGKMINLQWLFHVKICFWPALLHSEHLSFKNNKPSRPFRPSPNFHSAKATCDDAHSTFNETYMQVTCPNVTVLAVSKHLAYSLFPAVYFWVVMLTAGCTVICSFSRHQPMFSAGDFYLCQVWWKMQDHCSLVIIV